MNASSVRLLLECVMMLFLVEIALISAASLTNVDRFNPNIESLPRELFSVNNNNNNNNPIRRSDLQHELGKQLTILRAAEQNIVQHIQALEAERIALSQRKRSHFDSMCMFNVVACYRRRK